MFKNRFDIYIKAFGTQDNFALYLGYTNQSSVSSHKKRDGRMNSATIGLYESKGINTGWLIKGKGTPWNNTDAGKLIKEKIESLDAKFWLEIKKLTVYEAPIDDRSFTLADGDDGEIIPRKDPLGYHGKVLLPRIIEFLIRKHGSWKKASNKYKKNVEYPDNFIRDGRIDIHFLEELFEDGLDVNYLLSENIGTMFHKRENEVKRNEEFRNQNPDQEEHLNKVRNMVNELYELVKSKKLIK